MNYNFTDRVRKLLALSREEAIRLRHDYVGTEHILLGLTREGEGVAIAVLTDSKVTVAQVRQLVESSVRAGHSTIERGELPYTSRAKKVLELSMAAARDLSHSYVGTEHLLLGLLREEKGIAAQVLGACGITESRALAKVRQILGIDAAEFEIEIDDMADVSIYEQIVARVREAVATGELAPGARLPPVRRLADSLDIAPGTVARAYSELERLGVVMTEGARGTRVKPRAGPVRRELDPETLIGLLRPVAVAAYHMGSSADELRSALDAAMADIF